MVGSALDEIRAGYTPNPDIWCNSRVKFGAFLDYLRQNHPGEFDRVVSGHYARVRRELTRLEPKPGSIRPTYTSRVSFVHSPHETDRRIPLTSPILPILPQAPEPFILFTRE